MTLTTKLAADKLRPDPSHDEYVRQWAEMYEASNYGKGMAGYFLRRSHVWSERPFGPDTRFSKVLEVGAGTGIHVRFVRHAFDEYWLTDLNPPFLEKLVIGDDTPARGRIHIKSENATALSFPDNTFDRLIAAHVLEHLPQPHLVLREWVRVLRPGGILSLVLPCDPGVAWRVGRAVGSRGKFVKAGMAYDYWMAREHVNPINNLTSFIQYYFKTVDEEWWPFRVPSMDLNLFYIAHILV